MNTIKQNEVKAIINYINNKYKIKNKKFKIDSRLLNKIFKFKLFLLKKIAKFFKFQ